MTGGGAVTGPDGPGPARADEPSPVLTGDQIDQFATHGYVTIEGLVQAELVTRLEAEVDRWVNSGLRAAAIAACLDTDGATRPPVMEIELPAHAELVTFEPLLRALTQLLGPAFVFHHLHSDRHPPGDRGKAWHHDYEQYPQLDRTYAMVHALHYLGGLDRSVAALAVLPGSHRRVMDKGAYEYRGTAQLPGEIVVERLPPGSTVLIHSAIVHARRPASPPARVPRYFVDASYCQAGRRWPPAKPYWRQMLSRARQLELDDGRWPELFDDRHFAPSSPEG